MFAPIAVTAVAVFEPISSKNNIYTMEEINANWDTDNSENYDVYLDDDYENMWDEYERLCDMYD